MSIASCVVCGATTAEPVLAVDRAPIHPFCPPADLGIAPGFGTLRIVSCSVCGHLYNAAFDADRIDELYAAAVLTNTPVSESMIKNLEATADYVLSRSAANPTVVDVGGGTGVLARTLARRAAEVHLVEPSRALTREGFAGSGVTLHRCNFPAPALADRQFDVVVSRQVVEHIPEPMAFLQALRAQLAPRGVAYLEIPSAEYIEQTRSVVDFHYPHVHYYRRDEFQTLLARAGFEVIEVVDVKEGHDRGFLLRATEPTRLPYSGRRAAGFLRGDLAERIRAGRQRLDALAGTIALYGANAYSQALFGLFPGKCYTAMFDDTPMYEGQRAYGPGIDVVIRRPSIDAIENVSAVVITAYLHDLGIAQRLRQLGFHGQVFTVRSDDLAGRDGRPAAFFDVRMMAT